MYYEKVMELGFYPGYDLHDCVSLKSSNILSYIYRLIKIIEIFHFQKYFIVILNIFRPNIFINCDAMLLLIFVTSCWYFYDKL